jgi:hypothetical protein
MIYTWKHYGETLEDWNASTNETERLIPLFNNEGYGRFFKTPEGKYTRITAHPVISGTYEKQKGWGHTDDVDMVIVFDFVLPNGEMQDNRVLMEVKKDYLNPIIVCCGISPMQLKICFYQAVAYLTDK